jgi:flagellar basal-body rod modification protein FlgD
MNTSNVQTATAPGAAAAKARTTGGMQGLTTNDFLTLMTAQIKNQDPLNPTDSNQFLSQLAQLSTVTGISSMNTTMSNLSSAMMSSQALSSASLVGHGIQTPADGGVLVGGRSFAGAVQVPAGASSVMLAITDPAGVVVRHIPLAAAEGLQDFRWDGANDAGAAAPSGAYGISAAAIVGGKNQAITTFMNGTVNSVTLDASGSGVTLNTPELGAVALTSVRQIS